jgi:hypothetical protein
MPQGKPNTCLVGGKSLHASIQDSFQVVERDAIHKKVKFPLLTRLKALPLR